MHAAPPPAEPAWVHLDDHIAVVDKPSGWLVHPTSFVSEGTVVQWVSQQLGESVYLCHRLDRGTSGLMVLGRSPDAARRIQSQWMKGQVEKRYEAWTTGAWAGPEVIRLPIGRVDGRWTVDEAGKAAETRVISAEPGRLTRLVLHPVTGRTHQLRIHLAASGCAIAGDLEYGGASASRVWLLSTELCFRHPASHERVRMSLPPTERTAVEHDLGVR